MAATTEGPRASTISETEAARRIGVNAQTLRLWRIDGKLAEGLATVTPSPMPTGRAKVRYDAAWLDAYVTAKAGGVPDEDHEHNIFASAP